MTQLIHLDGNSLTLEEVIAVARHGAQCELDEQAKEAVIASRKIVDDIVREKRVVYGVTTGFGSLCNVSISRRYCSTARKPDPNSLIWLR